MNNNGSPTCALCGEDSRGEAGIGDKFYCHRDERSCYMAVSRIQPSRGGLVKTLDSGDWTGAAEEIRDHRDAHYPEETK